jgi:hypothetical protein
LKADGSRPTEAIVIKEIVVAKVIEFYIPMRFRRPLKAAAPAQFGKIVEFCPPTKKSA